MHTIMKFIKKKIYIIIPVHNRKAITLKCLKILKNNGDLDKYYAVVVDDGSMDGTSQAIKERYPDVIILEGDGNLWWTGAIKIGMEYAYQQGADYIIWLNDDILSAENTLSLMIEFLKEHPNSIVAPACKLYGKNETIENGCVGRTPFKAIPGKLIAVESISGYCAGFPAGICQIIGYPNALKFPHYYGDETYTKKAFRANFKLYLYGDIFVELLDYDSRRETFWDYLNTISSESPSYKNVFFFIKSRYYIPSQYYYLCEKYGFITGLMLFILRASSWLAMLTTFKLIKLFSKIIH